MAEIKAKVGESRMDLIRRAQPGDMIIFNNECLEKKYHCFDQRDGHDCFNCCYCNLPNTSERQFQDDVTKDFKRVHGKKFVIIPAKSQRIYEKTADILKAERIRILRQIYDRDDMIIGCASDFNGELVVVDLEKLKKVIGL